MKVTLLGTGAAWPDVDRTPPGFLIEYKGNPYLIDCGGGISHQLMKVGTPPKSLDNIFLTHIHIDHCVELPSLVFGAYLTGKEGSFHVFGPPGTKHFTTSIFDDTYDFAKQMMKKIRKKDIDIITTEINKGKIFEKNGLVIESIPVEHGFPTVAYKFIAEGKKIVFSGDTAPCKGITDISNNADILFIECSFPEHVGIKPNHCIPSQVANIAKEASVKKIILIHLFPNCKGYENAMIEEIQKTYDGPVEIGNDLQEISI